MERGKTSLQGGGEKLATEGVTRRFNNTKSMPIKKVISGLKNPVLFSGTQIDVFANHPPKRAKFRGPRYSITIGTCKVTCQGDKRGGQCLRRGADGKVQRRSLTYRGNREKRRENGPGGTPSHP